MIDSVVMLATVLLFAIKPLTTVTATNNIQKRLGRSSGRYLTGFGRPQDDRLRVVSCRGAIFARSELSVNEDI